MNWNLSYSYPSQYTTTEIIILSIIITIMMIIVVVGNMLVIIAIATEHSLNSVQNWFIASLAFADLSLGLIVMPFSLAHELLGYWMFGSIWCDVHGALDVLLCTSSIMNLCLISLDRYWSITRAMDYLTNRTRTRVIIYIMAVWALSGFISIPPLLGWKKDPDLGWFEDIREYQKERNLTDFEFVDYLHQNLEEEHFNNFTASLVDSVFPKCQLSEEPGYVLYSALGSFYLPSCIMVFVYINIYFAARARARRHIKPKGSVMKKENYSMGKTADPPPANGTEQAAKLLDNNPSGQVSPSGEKKIAEGGAVKPTIIRENNGTEKEANTKRGQERENGEVQTKTVGLEVPVAGGSRDCLTNNNEEGQELSSECSHHNTGCIRLRSTILPKLRFGRRLSKEAREMIDIGKIPVRSVSKNLDKMNADKSNTEKEKKRIARKKERRATLILGMIMGSFIACWFPFFLLYIISPICPTCSADQGQDQSVCVSPTAFSTAFWLGYSNSAFNPVIYTVFNNDFRRAFKKILFK